MASCPPAQINRKRPSDQEPKWPLNRLVAHQAIRTAKSQKALHRRHILPEKRPDQAQKEQQADHPVFRGDLEKLVMGIIHHDPMPARNPGHLLPIGGSQAAGSLTQQRPFLNNPQGIGPHHHQGQGQRQPYPAATPGSSPE